ncbi:phage tail protein [Simplicispira psychrophila]|uniref:phage tail protein n=1 Tax=Simplicispira psychrophila TaxID=80882 RepID=UPI000485D03C|nr:tail fiber protein [Simplicispira psychrophila]
MDPFLGEIRAFAFGRIPNGWLPCDGRELNVQQNQALYALLGTRYGGTLNQKFNLPDLRGRTPVCYGPGMAMGLKEGSETVALNAAQVPPHTHTVLATSAAASTSSPAGGALATLPTGTNAYAAPGTTTLNTAAVSTSGASAPHQNMQPSLAVNWCIAISGLFPPRQ